MSILEEIVSHKRREVAEAKELSSVKLLEKSIYFNTPCVSLKQYLLRTDRVGIIAEIKRRSPSRGVINENISVERLSIGYMQAGASALSVLTDGKFFGGSSADLTLARRFNYCPILRKDFVIDEYQLIEAKSIGADAALLIAQALSPAEVKSLAAFAKKLGLEVLLEVHSLKELEDSLCEGVDAVGVNNRNLSDMTVDLQTSFDLAAHIPAAMVKISESGIDTPHRIIELKQAGYNGFLMGEAFMRSGCPEDACAKLIRGAWDLMGERHA